MIKQTLHYSFLQTKEDNSVSFINSEMIKEKLTQSQSAISSPIPKNFSLQNRKQHLLKQNSMRKKAILWSKLQQLYYFDSVLRFVIDKPYLTVSWAQWKPLTYYKYIQQRMYEILGTCGRNHKLIKAKDQNLKKKYHNRGNRKIDLVQVAISELINFVNKFKNRIYKDKNIEMAIQRCDSTLKNYQIKLNQMKKPKTYQIQLANLVRFISIADCQARKIQSKNSSFIRLETEQSSLRIMDLRN